MTKEEVMFMYGNWIQIWFMQYLQTEMSIEMSICFFNRCNCYLAGWHSAFWVMVLYRISIW